MPRILMRLALLLACSVLVSSAASAQVTSRATLETSETLFSVLTAMNACGYDQDLESSEPIRAQIRTEVARAAQASEPARSATEALCAFYREHQSADSSRTLAQYVSLALNLGAPPSFPLAVKEAEMPPDATFVLGFVPVLQRFYQTAGLHRIWEQHKAEYEAIVERSHNAISNMLLGTDVYLRIPVSGYLGRRLLILAEPMAAPGQVNSRIYGTNYYLVVSPEKGELRIDAIRHTYLHFTLDPVVAKRSTATIKRLEPLLSSVKTAPMADDFKSDIRLLLTESLIRAVEARTSVNGKTKQAETRRENLAQSAAEEGYILAPYFQSQLAKFEKETDPLDDALLDWLFRLDMNIEQKRAAEIVFATSARPEGVQRLAKSAGLLDEAGRRFAAGDVRRARQLAEQALDEKREDQGRALFLLAQVASKDKEMERAQEYFERAATSTSDAQVVAWSHIYLGRICDLKAERESAVRHYQQALAAAGDDAARAAAQGGIEHPYEPPRARQQEQQQ